MKRTGLGLSAIALAAAGLGGSAPAQASIGFGILPISVAFSAITPPRQTQCRLAANAGPAAAATGSVSKATAILGGKVSQLELMALQQAASSPLQTALTGAPTAEPNAFGPDGNCPQFALPMARLPGSAAKEFPRGPDDFLASARVAIKHTRFDAAWSRVRGGNLPRGLTGNLIASGAGTDLLGTVNAWTNARVRSVEDTVQYGQADYWASASATLASGAGDCEDIAIAKLQILAAMGVSRSDMYLTITRDLIRNADHAVLIVKQRGKFWLLDNSTDQVLDAAQSNHYRPIMSFSASRSWLHGNWHPRAR